MRWRQNLILRRMRGEEVEVPQVEEEELQASPPVDSTGVVDPLGEQDPVGDSVTAEPPPVDTVEPPPADSSPTPLQ
jgi:hypothetical protein